MSERWMKQADIPGMEPLITQYCRDVNAKLEDGILLTVEKAVGFHVDKDRLLQALTDASAFYEEGYRAAMATVSETERVRCADCKHLMYSDCYGECGAGHRGVVRPDDTCPHGERRAEHDRQRT